MNETYALARVSEGYDRMISGKARGSGSSGRSGASRACGISLQVASNARHAESGGVRAAPLGEEQAAKQLAQEKPARGKPPRPRGG
jgi:hypothetical protein